MNQHHQDAATLQEQLHALWDMGAHKSTHPQHAEFQALVAQARAVAPEAERFRIDTPEKLEWFISKRADIDSRLKRMEAQYRAMKKELEREAEWLDIRFAAEAEAITRSLLSGRKKSVKFLSGTAGIRKTPVTVSVLREVDAQQMFAQHPDLSPAIKTVIDLSAVKGTLQPTDSGELLLTTTGEVLQPDDLGLMVRGGEEKFYIKAGQE